MTQLDLMHRRRRGPGRKAKCVRRCRSNGGTKRGCRRRCGVKKR